MRKRVAGNSCSYIEPGKVEEVVERAVRFVSAETLSPEWRAAVREGFRLLPALRGFWGVRARKERVTPDEARNLAAGSGILLQGGRIVVGVLATVALWGVPVGALLDPFAEIDEG